LLGRYLLNYKSRKRGQKIKNGTKVTLNENLIPERKKQKEKEQKDARAQPKKII